MNLKNYTTRNLKKNPIHRPGRSHACIDGNMLCITLGHVYIGMIFYASEIQNGASITTSDWLFNTQSRVLQADWLIQEKNEKENLNINMPH